MGTSGSDHRYPPTTVLNQFQIVFSEVEPSLALPFAHRGRDFPDVGGVAVEGRSLKMLDLWTAFTRLHSPRGLRGPPPLDSPRCSDVDDLTKLPPANYFIKNLKPGKVSALRTTVDLTSAECEVAGMSYSHDRFRPCLEEDWALESDSDCDESAPRDRLDACNTVRSSDPDSCPEGYCIVGLGSGLESDTATRNHRVGHSDSESQLRGRAHFSMSVPWECSPLRMGVPSGIHSPQQHGWEIHAAATVSGAEETAFQHAASARDLEGFGTAPSGNRAVQGAVHFSPYCAPSKFTLSPPN